MGPGRSARRGQCLGTEPSSLSEVEAFRGCRALVSLGLLLRSASGLDPFLSRLRVRGVG